MSENNEFKKRIFGAAIIKAINSNYNADFSGQPRTLPDGKVYATDKALKYTIKNYIKDNYEGDIFYFKKLKETYNPMSLDEKFESTFPDDAATKDKKIISRNLLTCRDIRLFGATYANKIKKVNVSIHGPVQINHGVNIWHENNIYSEQITAPFGDPKKSKTQNTEIVDKDSENSFDEAAMTTIGRQSKLQEGHYLHHFSVNPKNLEEVVELAGTDAENLSLEDINILKEAFRKGATYYDSAAKAGTENEFLIWVELNKDSKLVLPNFTQLIKMKDEKEKGLVVLDLSELKNVLSKYNNDIEKIEIYRNKASIKLENLPESCKIYSL
jgi:CRISPR-associated protein Csh2